MGSTCTGSYFVDEEGNRRERYLPSWELTPQDSATQPPVAVQLLHGITMPVDDDRLQALTPAEMAIAMAHYAVQAGQCASVAGVRLLHYSGEVARLEENCRKYEETCQKYEHDVSDLSSSLERATLEQTQLRADHKNMQARVVLAESEAKRAAESSSRAVEEWQQGSDYKKLLREWAARGYQIGRRAYKKKIRESHPDVQLSPDSVEGEEEEDEEEEEDQDD